MIKKSDLVTLGFTSYMATKIIRDARFYLINSGLDWYKHSYYVPRFVVESLVGIKIL